MSTNTCLGEKQTPRKLLLADTGDYEFRVTITVDGWSSTRSVRIIDTTANITELMEQIASNSTSVTDPTESEGQIFLTEGGRQYLIAAWQTDDVYGDFFDTQISIGVPIPAREDAEWIELECGDLAAREIDIELARYDNDGNLIK